MCIVLRICPVCDCMLYVCVPVATSVCVHMGVSGYNSERETVGVYSCLVLFVCVVVGWAILRILCFQSPPSVKI